MRRVLLTAILAVAPAAGACKGGSDDSPPAVEGASRAPAAGGESGAVSKAASARPAEERRAKESEQPGDGDHLHDSLARCPLEGDALRDPDEVLEAASRSFDDREYAAALACAEVGADLMPQGVEVHHLRAASLAALGRHDDAQVAFTMALALDPDDPETLAAAADFYINVLPAKRRDTTLVGYEHARRGRARAVSRRNRNRPLQARLALIEAQALNDLGRSEEALPRIREALELAPRLVEATHERGVARFNLCKFEAARADFLAVLSKDPEDPYAHHYLGLIYERLERAADAEAHLERARELAPEEFGAPVAIDEEAFRAEVARAVAELPARLRVLLEDVQLEIEELPKLADLTADSPPLSPTILGLFRGLPLGVEAPEGVEVPPRAIVLYRKNLARAVGSRAELDQQIRRTLVHEIGHLRGLDEDELRRRGLE